MSKCTAKQALDAFAYWLGYCEKASKAYAQTRDKSSFTKNAWSANYTYMGYLIGLQAQPWCAMTVSTVLYEACGGKDGAKEVMYGLWPYTACDQLYEKAPYGKRGRRGNWEPKPGDVIVFGYSTRDHTGMVYAVDDTYVYTYEGNSSNKCQKRSYLRTSSWIWGYVRPDYAEGDEPVIEPTQYGQVVCTDPVLHLLSKGCAGDEVKTVQRICYSRGFKGEDGKPITADGDFGRNTKYAVMQMQKALGITSDGYVGAETWTKMLKELS